MDGLDEWRAMWQVVPHGEVLGMPGRGEASRHLGGFYGWIVAAASVREPGAWSRTAIPCRRRPRGKRCAGYLRTRAIDVPSSVMWACEKCEDHGLVRNWHRTSWNLRAATRLSELDLLTVVLSDRQYTQLREGDPLAVVAGALPEREGRVVLRASAVRLEQLLAQLAEYADLETSPSRQRRMLELCDTLQDAVLQAQRPRRAVTESRR